MPRPQLRKKKNAPDYDKLALNGSLVAQAASAIDADFEIKDRLKNMLIYEEGKVVLRPGVHVAYRDSKGIFTIGYGFNLQDASAARVLRQVTTKPPEELIARRQHLTEQEAQALLMIAENVALGSVPTFFPDFSSIDRPRRVVLGGMVYQMGAMRFGKFKRLIPAVRHRNWPLAASSMKQSQWARRDSPKRARRMAQAMASGRYPASANPSPPGQDFATSKPQINATAPADTSSPETSSSSPQRERSPWPFDN